MKIRFCNFNESTTISEIKERYEREENCNEINKFRKEFETPGLFDAIFSILLGGTSNKPTYRLNYIKTVYNKEKNDGSTWQQNAKTHTIGTKNSNDELGAFISGIKDSDTLQEVYNKLQNWTKWQNEKKNRKEIFLSALKEGTDKMNLKNEDLRNENIEILISNNIEKNKQVIFTGAPGTGKTWAVREYVKHQCEILDENKNLIVDKNQYKFVQFHPSYDYSDFVEGLRPVVLKGQTEPTFVRMDGVFKAFCRHIVQENNKEENNKEENNKNKNYYFIVDEINRADLAKVFGELMFGLEESYRGKKNPIITQYINLDTYRIIQEDDITKEVSESDNKEKITEDDIGKAIPLKKDEDVFKDGFYIPENLYFIGTMNDIDRSVDSMDFALRRRFQWVEIKANEVMSSSLHNILDKGNNEKDSDKYKTIEELANKVIAMNNKISSDDKFGLSDAYHIGPAYFKELHLDESDSLEKIFNTNIRSILREYTRGRKNENVEIWIEQCRQALLGDN